MIVLLIFESMYVINLFRIFHSWGIFLAHPDMNINFADLISLVTIFLKTGTLLMWRSSLLTLVTIGDSAGKESAAMQETWFQSLGWEDTLEKETATHSSILAWRIPWTVYSMESQIVLHDWETFTSHWGTRRPYAL